MKNKHDGIVQPKIRQFLLSNIPNFVEKVQNPFQSFQPMSKARKDNPMKGKKNAKIIQTFNNKLSDK